MTPVPERLADALADRYRIERELGAGGMATVYLAEDLKHDRKVALKVLKPELAAVLGAERFVVEIKTTAALQHPHILPLFDSGTADGFLFYVMPFIDGETLRAKLDRETQLGVDEAVKIASEVADALHYAHEHGVIHRDIKPENILLANGRPMVADFGIALAVSAAAGGRMTETGLSLGTPHYMSPEQATAEKEITRRSDLYSLASVLFEMLTGQPPHLGGSAQQIIMKIITEQPVQVTTLRKAVPPHVAAAVAKALEKLPADRFETADAFAKALADRGFANSTAAAAYGVTSGGGQGKGASRTALYAAVGVAVLSLGLAAALALRPESPRPVRRFVVELPIVELRTVNEAFRRFLPTADGEHLVVVDSANQLAVRRRDALELRALPGTTGAVYPFESPDGLSIGFLSTNGSSLHAVPLEGGPVRTLADSGSGIWGATWSADGYVYASSSSPISNGLMRIHATRGGAPESVTTLGPLEGHVFPVALPEGRGILFTVQRGTGTGNSSIAVTVPGSGTHRELTPGTKALYAASGHLLILATDGSLLAAPFDLESLELTGDPVPMVQGLVPQAAFDGEGELHITNDGTLWYQTGTRSLDVDPVWVTRTGIETPAQPNWGGRFGALAISPDGRRVAYSDDLDGRSRIWIAPLDGSGSPTLFEREGSFNDRPAWTPDGRSVAWLSNRAGTNEILMRSVDGQQTARRIVGSEPLAVWEVSFARTGPWMLYRAETKSSEIFGLRPGVDSVGRAFVSSNATERQPALSPDGRWLAYTSNEDGAQNIYVRPFPGTNDAVWQVTTDGGVSPRWSPDGRELFYTRTVSAIISSVDGQTQTMMAVPVRAGESFAWGPAQELFAMRPYRAAPNAWLWDVSPRDGRFLMLRRRPEAERPRLIMVENFFTELRAKAPAR